MKAWYNMEMFERCNTWNWKVKPRAIINNKNTQTQQRGVRVLHYKLYGEEIHHL